MSGVTKHIFDLDINELKTMWTKQLRTIQPVLPKHYCENDAIAILKEFYPYEWESAEIKYRYYKEKDKHLKKILGKTRYNMNKPHKILKELPLFKMIISFGYMQKWAEYYSEEKNRIAHYELYAKRNPKIQKVMLYNKT